MTGSKKDSDLPPQTKERKGWNLALMTALKDKEQLARISQDARQQIMSTEYLYRVSQRTTNGFTDNKMKAAGDEVDL